MTHEFAQSVAALVECIKPLLAGHPAEIQGAALADCLAIWLSGHHVPGNADATCKMRAELLAEHCCTVRQLTEVNAHLMGTDK